MSSDKFFDISDLSAILIYSSIAPMILLSIFAMSQVLISEKPLINNLELMKLMRFSLFFKN